MMQSLNAVQLIGNVGAEPEVKYLDSGIAVAKLSVATSESWKDKATGKWESRTTWHNVTAWRFLAEKVERYIRKGDPVYVSGKIDRRKWTDKDGIERYSVEVIADTVFSLGQKEKRSPQAEPASEAGPTTPGGDGLPF